MKFPAVSLTNWNRDFAQFLINPQPGVTAFDNGKDLLRKYGQEYWFGDKGVQVRSANLEGATSIFSLSPSTFAQLFRCGELFC